MNVETRQRYENFARENDLPVFFNPWWLDIVCQKGSWNVCLVPSKEEKIVGSLPYYLTSFLGFKIIRTPPFTPYLGVWLDHSTCPERNIRKYGFENQVIDELIGQLPKVAWYHQIHPEQLQNWLPFYWKGFRQTTRYTYIFEELDAEKISSEMESTVRNKIRKAENRLKISCEDDLAGLLQTCEKTFKRQRLKSPLDKEILTNLHREIQKRSQGSIYFAKDENRKTHAAMYLIWDKSTAYCWMLGADTELRKSGAVQLLLWHSIQEVSKIVKRYNFEGSMLPHIEPVFRAFGAERKPVFQIRKSSNRFLEVLRVLLKG